MSNVEASSVIEMSSIESMVLDIEEDYNDLLKKLEAKVDLQDSKCRFKKVTENEILGLLRKTMRFQRKIEYVLDQMEKSMKAFPAPERPREGEGKGLVEVSEEQYAEMLGVQIKEAQRRLRPVRRLNQIAKEILDLLTTDEAVDRIGFYAQYNSVAGVITNLKSALENYQHASEDEARRQCYCAYFGFKKIYVNLVEMEEELRYIAAITTYPIEMKIKLKEQLVLNTFESVAISFEEAETNVEQEHFKDCISRCRDAIEFFIAQVREKETGHKTEKKFVKDFTNIVQIGVFDDATKNLAQGVYSFLSLKGSHKYDESKISIYDAETALKESYSLIEMLLRKYLDYLKRKEKWPKPAR